MGAQNRLAGWACRAMGCAVLLSGCATGSNSGDVTDSGSADSGTTPIDAAIVVDSSQGTPDGMIVSDGAIPDAALPDAAIPDAAIPDAPNCVVTTVELLTNGNFDLGAGTWIESSEGAFPIVVNDSTVTGLTADTPIFVAWLGGYSSIIGDVTDTLLQDVLVPMDATPLSFSGKFRIVSEETSSTAFDELKLQIIAPVGGTILEEVSVWSNTDANTTWETFTGSATGDYAGQTIRVRFIATMDFSLNTSFFIDSWSATTSSCQ